MSEFNNEKREQLLDEASRSTSGLPRDFDPRDERALKDDAERSSLVLGEQRRRDVLGSYTVPMPDGWFRDIED